MLYSPRATTMQALWLSLLFCWALHVSAAGDCAPDSGTTTVASESDLQKIKQCSNFRGNIDITDGIEKLDLDGFRTISGNLTMANFDKVTSVTSTTLTDVQNIMFHNLSSLASIQLPALKNVSNIGLRTLHKLSDSKITSGSMTRDVQSVQVVDTSIPSLDWLTWPVVARLTVAVNPKLTQFSLPYQHIGTGSTYEITGNGALKELNVSALNTIDGSLEISGNGNDNMTFSNLQWINGYVRLVGPFQHMAMPGLVRIFGALRVEVIQDGNIIEFCDWLSTLSTAQGHYDCTANSTKPATPTQISPNEASPSSKNNADSADNERDPETGLSTASKIGISVAICLAAIISSLGTYCFFRRRTRAKKQQDEEVVKKVSDEEIARQKNRESSSTMDPQEHELESPHVPVELGTPVERYEMPGPDIPMGELPATEMKELDGTAAAKYKERRNTQVFELPA